MSGFGPQGLPFVVLLTVISVLSCALPALGQSTVLRGFVVHAADDRPIVGRVRVTALRVDVPSAKAVTVASDEFGYFQFPPLTLGRYELTIALQPFQPHVEIVDVVRDPIPTVVLRLQFRDVEDIDVHSPTPAASRLRLPDGSTGAVFSREEIDDLPQINGRTVQSLLALVPNIVFTDSVGTLAQYTAGGQRRFANRLTIDGMSADLALDVRGRGIGEGASGGLPATATSGGTQTLVPQEAIEEISVRTSAMTAEHAGAPGAQTSIVTRSGGDKLSATAFGLVRPNAWSASDWFANAGQAPERENSLANAGASTGGAIRQRWRYFATWEQLAINRASTATIEVPSQEARDAAPLPLRQILDAFPQPNGRALGSGLAAYTNRVPVGSRLWTVSGRVDFIGGRNRFFARSNVGRSAGDALGAAPFQFAFLSYSRREATSGTTATAGWTWLGTNALSESRFNVSDLAGRLDYGVARHGGAQPIDLAQLIPQRSSNTAAMFVLSPGPYGTVASGRARQNQQRQIQASNAFAAVYGRHEIKVGVEYSHVATSVEGSPHLDNYRFGGVSRILQGVAAQGTFFQIAPAEVTRHAGALFAQDTWRLSDALTIDYGFRYSVAPAPLSSNGLRPLLLDIAALPKLQTFPEGTRPWRTSWTNIAPRVGVAYRTGVSGTHSTTWRTGWGLVFDSSSPGATAYGAGYPYVTGRQELAFFPLTDIQPPLPEPFQAVDLSQYYAFPSDLPNSFTNQWQLGLDQELAADQRLGLSYVGAYAGNLMYWFAYPTTTPRMSINAFAPLGASEYHALLAEYVKRLSRQWQARASYTWSHAIDTDSGESVAPSPPPVLVPVASNRGSADFDRRHAATLFVSYQLRTSATLPTALRLLCDGWDVSAVLSVKSGAPFTVLFDRTLDNGSYQLRLDADATVPMWLRDTSSPTGRRLNPAAFVVPTSGRQGKMGRNSLRSAPLRQVDVHLSKTMGSGRSSVGVRLEVFNVFNTPHFGRPASDYQAIPFGVPYQSYADALGTGTLTGGGLAPLQQQGGPRSIQLGIKVNW